MTTADILARIADVMAEWLDFNPASIAADDQFRTDLGMPWYELVIVVVAVEEKFNIAVTGAEMLELETVGQLVDLVAARMSEVPS
jgi:acyl carrier protein